jgi:HAD superfamily hydrolase (TIGR01509 family)
MDGTLVDSAVVLPAAFVHAVRELGGPDLEHADVVAAYARGTPEVILAHLLDRPLGPGDAAVFYDELSGSEVDPYPGIAGVLEGLRARGLAVAIFTGASSQSASILLAAAGIAADVLVTGEEVQHAKPAGDGLVLAAERLGVPPAELAYVGDSPLDLRAAAAAGSRSAAAAWGHLYDPGEPANFTLQQPADALALLDSD